MISIVDIARLSGVSTATVSRIINNSGYVSEETRRRVMEVIKQYNYKPNALAKGLVTKKSNLIGLLVPQIDNPFFIRVIIAIESGLRSKGYNVLLCHSNESEENEERFLDILSEQRAAGIIAAPVGTRYEHYDQIAKLIPTVFLTRHFKTHSSNWVDMDNYGSSYNIMKHLIGNGNRKIAVLRHHTEISSIWDRLDGMWAACRDFGLPKENVFLIDAGISFDYAREKVLEFLDQHPDVTAIYSLYTMPALGAMKALATKGLRVPEDVSVAAFNGMEDSEYRSLFAIPLTGNHHPTEEMCEKAIEMLLHNIKGLEETGAVPEQESCLFPMNLIVEASSNFQRS